ncbi:MAG: F0F1 ATP synthase subunit B [Candidatus Nanopelagicales bacterium]|nr:F0F1 ATP synthase subunit B [Candidatus Nanopelagicales bacterium]MDZ4249116.1 F0F1 ATP synthase subunit B [Candidatus Nanopelagicales bacterium]
MLSISAVVLASSEGSAPPPNVLGVPMDEFIVGMAAFLIVFGVLAKFALPSISEALKKRTDAIEGGLKRAEEAETAAKGMLDQYQNKIAGAHDEAAGIRAKAESDGRQIVGDAKAQAEVERAAIAARAEAQLGAERTQTLAALRRDVGGMAVDLAGRIVGEAMQDDKRANAVVDRFIAELERVATESGQR